MKLRVYQLDSCMAWALPMLQSHFEEIQLQVSLSLRSGPDSGPYLSLSEPKSKFKI